MSVSADCYRAICFVALTAAAVAVGLFVSVLAVVVAAVVSAKPRTLAPLIEPSSMVAAKTPLP